jgi:YgiT-type zinc finger domain-containing protein
VLVFPEKAEQIVIPGPEGRSNKMNPSTCARCGGTLERQTITHTQLWGNELYEFESVPALVCLQCSEVWLDAGVAQLIEKIVQQQPQLQPKKYHQVPVFSLAEFSL